MANVLIVDDSKQFLLSLSEGLNQYAETFKVLIAENGKKAVALLKSTKVDLVVTDLKMPVMDGFELLAHMSKHFPSVPVIVMTAFGNPDVEQRLKTLGILQYVEKPLDFQDLADKILENLAGKSGGYIQGIALPAFLQLVELEQKTCIIKVSSSDRVGYLYFNKGELLDAETAEHKGEQAAIGIATWENAAIEIGSVSKKRKRNIDSSLAYILLEGFRIKDEKTKNQIERRDDDETVEAEIEEEILLGSSEEQKPHFFLTKEKKMALEKHIEALKEIKGYKAAGIMSFTGEMLAFDSSDSKIDLTLVGATFNDIFRSAHEASKKIGLEACKQTEITTPKGIIVMRCSGTDAKVHFHLIGIMAADGNAALMKMQIEKLVPAVMDELA